MSSSTAAAKLHRSASHASQRGLTLVELMVAMAISLFMLIAIALVYSSSKTGFVYANNTVRMSEDASFAVDSLSRDIRMASFGGCVGTIQPRTAGADAILNTLDDVFDNPTLSITTSAPKLEKVTGLSGTFDKPNPFDTGNYYGFLTLRNAVRGFPSGTGTEITAARALLHTTTPSGYVVSPTAPLLYLAGGNAAAYQVGVPIASGNSSVVLAGNPYAGPKFLADTFLMIADCKSSEIFRVTADTSTWTIATQSPLVNSYTADAVVTALQSSTYFLAKRDGAANASIYRRFYNGKAATFEELVPNVESVAFHYGENTSCLNNTNAVVNCTAAGAVKPSYVADVYRTSAADVTDWSRVVSVRIGLIMVSEDSRLAPETDASVNWIDGSYSPPSTTDKRLRRAYSTTVSIRNRMGL